MLTPTDASLVPIARLEAIAPPGFWVTYLPLIIPVAVAIVAAVVTILIQLRVLRATKQEKASESVVQIVTSQGRDYYFAVSGALKEFASTLERLSRAAAPLDREHLSRRAFFFFGIFLYKENEFAFRYGYLYLGHLWAEAAIRRILDEVSSLFLLAPPDEAVVHKCFSDMDRLHRGATMPEHDPCLFKIRTLYDLEAVLISKEASESVRDLQRVFSSVRAHFTDQARLQRLQALARDFRRILEYEFTKLFQDWYAGPKGERQIPQEPPPDFDKIAGRGSWAEVLKTLNEYQ